MDETIHAEAAKAAYTTRHVRLEAAHDVTTTGRPTAGRTGAATVFAVMTPPLAHLRHSPRDSFPLSRYPMFTQSVPVSR